ncbi:DUF3298 domain-containing protein [Terriglobus roseus]|uniref:Uncharacterized protein n=1 Tax=Terriglobus roseus TaxID=392734 RepID=A0A1H4LJ52_9BACT|nr:DUF3298 domain-containing protein [Terriglobus roseus]SEB70556.1 Protein of unknown function [Terriglobus roseus]
MSLRPIALVFAALAASCVSSYAASFDCAKAVRPIEKVICGDAKLSAADSGMAAAYRAGLPRLSSAGIGLLRADQVQWLAWSQQVCKVDEPEHPKAAACLQPLYADRAKQLRSAISVVDGLTLLKRTQFLAMPVQAEEAFGTPEIPGFGTLQASWPRADSDDPAWIAWSAAVEAHMLRMAGAGEQQGTVQGKRKLPFSWVDEMAEAQDTTLEAHLRSVDHGRVTAMLHANGMGHGAAHPFETSESMTWLLDAKRTLRAEDVFAGEAWKQIVGALCWDQLQKWSGKQYLFEQVNGPSAPDLQKVIADPTNWTLEKDGLHIGYPDYTIAPRVAQPEDAVLPWEQLKPVLAAGFVTP